MLQPARIKTICFTALLIAGFVFYGKSQICSPDYFFKRFQGNRAVYTNKVVTTTQGDILAGGSTLKIRGDFEDATDGWLTKLTARGVLLWSKRYFMPGFNSGGFLSIENATDSSYLVTARYGKYVKRADNTVEETDAASFLIHIDKFGNVLWVKRINNYINDSFLSSITKLQDNSFLIAGQIIKSSVPKMLLLNFDLDGNINWDKIFFVDSAQFGGPVVKQLSNGVILLCGLTFKAASNFSSFSDMGWFMHRIDPTTGSFLRSTGIYFDQGPRPNMIPLENINNIFELPNDTLVFTSSYSGNSFFGVNPGSREALIVKASGNGQVYQADGYLNTVPGCRLMDAQYINGKYRLLLDDGLKTLYAELNTGGDIINQKRYGNVYSLLQGYQLLDGDPVIRSFYTGRGQYALMGVMKAEDGGVINCMETPSQIVRDPITATFSNGSIRPEYITVSFPFEFTDLGQSVSWAHYNFDPTTDCLVTCCDNIRSDTTTTELCNSLSYRLPDNSVVRETGMYYVNVKNANNCDSVAYYDVRFFKKPAFDLGEDTCFINPSPVLLIADTGYNNYTWNNILSTTNTYTATQPGKYTLSITNLCGTGVDEIEIFKDCEYPVYMPGGFTPGNDGLNDYYGYPPQNRNRLVSLEIYNRWGQRVFFTVDKTKGWNGRIRDAEQPSGVYLYLLRMKTLDGKEAVKRGSLVLIRR
jgi:gliding motility-associated-like protein